MIDLLEPSSEQTTLSLLLVGFLFGIWHAREADHLAAVSTIVSERKNLWSATVIGGLWGIGHTLALFAVGVLVIFAKLQITGRMEAVLEAIVGMLLVFLGVNSIRTIFGDRSDHTHSHPAPEETAGVTRRRLKLRSLVVGMFHGLAGSAGLMLLVLPTIPSPAMAMVYILVFGIGSVAGMMVMSLLVSFPLYFTANRYTAINKGIRLLAGTFSLVWGAMLISEKLFTPS